MNRTFLVTLGLIFLLDSRSARSGDTATPVARLRSPQGTLLVRDDKAWSLPALFDPVFSGAELIALPGTRAMLEIKEGDLRLTLAGNLPDLFPSPSLESVVKLGVPAKRKLDLELVRGRILIENLEAGAANVRLRVAHDPFDVALLDKNSAVAVELFSRWPAGAPFREKPQAGANPAGELYFLVLTGKVEVELKGEKQTVQAPALYRWTTAHGLDGPIPLKKLPEWVRPGTDKSEKAKALHAAVEKLRLALAKTAAKASVAPHKAITQALEEEDARLRQVAALSALAVDDLALGIKALQDARAREVRSAAVTGLMHYIGRGSARTCACSRRCKRTTSRQARQRSSWNCCTASARRRRSVPRLMTP